MKVLFTIQPGFERSETNKDGHFVKKEGKGNTNLRGTKSLLPCLVFNFFHQQSSTDHDHYVHKSVAKQYISSIHPVCYATSHQLDHTYM